MKRLISTVGRQVCLSFIVIIFIFLIGCRNSTDTTQEAMPMAFTSQDNGRLGPAVSFEIGMYFTSVAQSPSHFIVAYADNEGSLKAKVGLIQGDNITFGEPTEFHKDENGSFNFSVFTLLSLDENRFLIIYRAETDELRINIGQREGMGIRFLYTPHYNAPVFDNNAAQDLSAVALSPDRFVLVYGATDSETGRRLGYTHLGIIKDNKIESGDKKAITTDQVYKTAVASKSGNEFIVAMSEEGNDGVYLSTSYCRIRDNNVEVLQRATKVEGAIREISINMMKGNKFVMGIVGEKSAVIVGEVYRNDILLGESFYFNAGSNSKIFVEAPSSNQLAFVYRSAENRDQSYISMGEVVGNQIKIGGQLMIDSKNTYDYNLSHLEGQKMLLLYGHYGSPRETAKGIARTAILPAPPGSGDIIPKSTNSLISLPMQDDHFIVGFVESKSGDASVAVGEHRGGEIIIDSQLYPFHVKGPDGKPARDLDATVIGPNKFVIVYSVGRKGIVSVGEMVGEKVEFGTPHELPDVNVRLLSVCNLGGERIALTYGNSGARRGEIFISKIEGRSVSFGSRYLFEAKGIRNSLDSKSMDNDKFIISYQSGRKYISKGLRLDEEELKISSPIDLKPFAIVELVKVDSEKFLIAHRNEESRAGSFLSGRYNSSSFTVESKENMFCENEMEGFSISTTDDNSLIFTYAKGEERFKPTSAFTRSAKFDGESFIFSAESKFSDKVTNFVNTLHLEDGYFVNCYTEGEDSGKATTRLGEIGGDGMITWD